MVEVAVPAAQPLARLANVELMQTGTWQLSTGPATFTVDDLANAVSALGCPAVRRPVLKLGHDSPMPIGDGEPCVGWVDNLATSDNGRTLVGDYAGMPGWLGQVAASAYPDRSVEGEFGYRCQMGHTHPFVVHAVALLGVTAPGIGSLQSLQDVAALYGVAAAAEPETGTRVIVEAKGHAMPNPNPRTVAGSVTSDDVSRAFYSSPLGASWDAWIEELQLDPLQLIYVDDATSSRARVPVVVGDGDGPDAVTFGDPVPVVIRYDDAAAVAASSPKNVIRFASRAESRPGSPPASPAATASGTTTEGGPEVGFIDDVRQRLGVQDDTADESGVLAALDEALAERAEPVTQTEPAPLPEGVTTISTDLLAELQVSARAGQEARRQQQREQRERLVAAAVNDGRIPPARREAWVTQLESDPGSAEVLASLAPGLIPVGPEVGASASSETKTPGEIAYEKIYGKDA